MESDSKEAALVIMRRGPYVLLGRKKKASMGTGKLNAPGGRREEGEALLRCAVREVEEEVGVKLDPDHLQLIGIIVAYVGEELFQRVYVYFAPEFQGEPRETDSMVPEFVPADSLPFGRMHEGDVFWFGLAAKGSKFHFRVWYEKPGEGYLKHLLRVGDPLELDAE